MDLGTSSADSSHWEWDLKKMMSQKLKIEQGFLENRAVWMMWEEVSINPYDVIVQ